MLKPYFLTAFLASSKLVPQWLRVRNNKGALRALL